MLDIIKDINLAEEKAAEIKAAAQEKAAAIAADAEARSAEIAKLSEAECKSYREKFIRSAEEQAELSYRAEIKVKRAEAAQYAAERLKNTDNAVGDIIRRITRGGC